MGVKTKKPAEAGFLGLCYKVTYPVANPGLEGERELHVYVCIYVLAMDYVHNFG
jgi:hypothetical protein